MTNNQTRSLQKKTKKALDLYYIKLNYQAFHAYIVYSFKYSMPLAHHYRSRTCACSIAPWTWDSDFPFHTFPGTSSHDKAREGSGQCKPRTGARLVLYKIHRLRTKYWWQKWLISLSRLQTLHVFRQNADVMIGRSEHLQDGKCNEINKKILSDQRWIDVTQRPSILCSFCEGRW